MLNDHRDNERKLVDYYQWKIEDVKKIWCFGPENKGPNLLVDSTFGHHLINEIKESCESSFQWTTKEGVLIEENMRGVRLNILDATLHSDAIHRGAGQIIPTFRRAIFGAQLLS